VEEIAWVFILLARQQGIDAAMLALPTTPSENAGGEAKPDTAKSDAAKSFKPWCIGVLSEGNVYLFDPLLGLPIPGPQGVTRAESGELVIQPATLAQVMADDGLLRRLDVDETHRYGVTASDLKQVAVLLEGSPTYLAARMQTLESQLAGTQKMVLTTSPTTQAEHWKAAGLTDVQLWLRPYQTIENRSQMDMDSIKMQLLAMLPFYCDRATPLLKGRMLQLKGKLIGNEGATKFYQDARPSNQDLVSANAPMSMKQLQMFAKQDASYWSGLIQYQRGNYPAAIDYFMTRTLLQAPNGPWTTGASYNLARTFEISGEAERAILQYQGNDRSVGHHGELLRAKWLQEFLAAAKAKAAEGDGAPKDPAK
jgi:hypothetical protein